MSGRSGALNLLLSQSALSILPGRNRFRESAKYFTGTGVPFWLPGYELRKAENRGVFRVNPGILST